MPSHSNNLNMDPLLIHPQVLQGLKALRETLALYMSVATIERVMAAYRVAQLAHEGQFRQSGEPYIIHPVAVAHTLALLHLEPDTICAALLHDVLEDTPVTFEQLAQQFGRHVAELVEGVSKLTKIKFENRVEAQAENFLKMLQASVKDIRVILIKFADRTHNMSTIDSLPPEKRARIARETLDIYAPIANRLGMHHFQVVFEDLCFSALNPFRYKTLVSAIARVHAHDQDLFEQVETLFKQRLEKEKIYVESIQGREKRLYSIYQKMRQKHLSFSEITDFYAFRIVVSSVDDCYRVLGIVHHLYKPLPERFKDYIALPKANGYQSLHSNSPFPSRIYNSSQPSCICADEKKFDIISGDNLSTLMT